MISARRLGMVTISGFAALLSASLMGTPADAAGPGKAKPPAGAKAGAAAPVVDPPSTKEPIKLTPEGLALGAIGGAVSMDDIVTIASSTGGRSLTRTDLVTVLQPDLDPDPVGGSCGSLSIGVGFAAVTATIE